MSTRYKIPGKTFLLGEYLVLVEGTALVAAHEPFWTLELGSEGRVLPAESPAMKYLNQCGRSDEVSLKFITEVTKGFGRSSAEFLAFFIDQERRLKKTKELFDLEIDVKKLLSIYSESHSYPVSGADLVAQFFGGIQELGLQSGRFSKHVWPFLDVHAVLVARNGVKPGTRDLVRIEKINKGPLLKKYSDALHAFKTKEGRQFAKLSEEYFLELHRQGFIKDEVIEDIRAIEMRFPLLGAKGCGAGGVDTLLLYCDAKESDDLVKEAAQWGQVIGKFPNCLDMTGLSIEE